MFLKFDRVTGLFLKFDRATGVFLKFDRATGMFLKFDRVTGLFLKFDRATGMFLKFDRATLPFLIIDMRHLDPPSTPPKVTRYSRGICCPPPLSLYIYRGKHAQSLTVSGLGKSK